LKDKDQETYIKEQQELCNKFKNSKYLQCKKGIRGLDDEILITKHTVLEKPYKYS
jgi:hypothetical protein